MPKALTVRVDIATADQLRAEAALASRPRTRLRLLAVADILEGRPRAEVSAALGLDRQALHDAVRNYNRDGPAGLVNRPRGHRRPTLTEAERAAVAAFVRARAARGGTAQGAAAQGGPGGRAGPSVKEVCAFVSADLNKTVHPWTVARLLRTLAGLPEAREGEERDGAGREVECRV